ncbi:Uma2 family endonuclease [Thiosulfativibrio zosterae]|uniref:Putative restriction endonuclease domain-containing protein n=1 Tax=Thiosulfativibrio zosterae TaxID=2675053 RepID=A0A6F8PQ91_9GAMM|nr:Uma2 family endonuclease [Thiosulfativibrio zosterae]BBP44279.1 hypothetical protein THMIRHAT_20250 [Thiosulfativibrio zosterae]
MSLAYLEHYTIRDYAAWDGDWELIQGAPYAMSPSPSISHQRLEQSIAAQLFDGLKQCLQCEVLSEVDWQIAEDTVVRPDILIACDIQGEKLTQTPELIVEVVSATSAKRDEQIKFELYQKEGVKTYVLAYPEHQVAKVYVLKEGRFIKAGDFVLQTYEFEVKGCKLAVDFSQVWRKLP